MPKLTHLELFGGIGGFSQAIATYFPHFLKTTGYCDIDEQAIAVHSHHFPHVPVFRDITKFTPKEKYDLIACTFPCTGTSGAGNRVGLSHSESKLWREGFRIMCQAKPRYFIWEQPLGFADRGLREIIGASRMAGYQEQIITVSASAIGAVHQRTRIFVVAYPDHWQRHDQKRWEYEARAAIEKVRNCAQWLSVKCTGVGNNYGLSVGLVRGSVFSAIAPDQYLVKNGLRHRPAARRLAAKAVTPAQAAIALSFIEFMEANHA
jgi:DNA (cytosine-5)-methyltransferase 1